MSVPDLYIEYHAVMYLWRMHVCGVYRQYVILRMLYAPWHGV